MDRPLKLGKSSHVRGGTYDPATERLTLELNGGTYAYHSVPAQLVEDFEKSPSHGQFFAQNIQKQHKFSRVR